MESAGLAQHFDVPSVSSGELLRELAAVPSESGRQIASYLSRGDLVPDDLIIAGVRDALAKAVSSGGYVLEGFPRTVTQARRPFLVPDAVIHLVVPDEVASVLARPTAGRAEPTTPSKR